MKIDLTSIKGGEGLMAALFLCAIVLFTHSAAAAPSRPAYDPSWVESHHDTVLTVMFCAGFMGDTATLMIDTHVVCKFILNSDPTLDYTGIDIQVVEHPLRGLYSINAPGNNDASRLYGKGQTLRIIVDERIVSIELSNALPKFCLVDKYPDRMSLDMRSHRPLFD